MLFFLIAFVSLIIFCSTRPSDDSVEVFYDNKEVATFYDIDVTKIKELEAFVEQLYNSKDFESSDSYNLYKVEMNNKNNVYTISYAREIFGGFYKIALIDAKDYKNLEEISNNYSADKKFTYQSTLKLTSIILNTPESLGRILGFFVALFVSRRLKKVKETENEIDSIYIKLHEMEISTLKEKFKEKGIIINVDKETAELSYKLAN